MKKRNPVSDLSPPGTPQYNLLTIQQELLELNRNVHNNIEQLTGELCGPFPIETGKTMEDSPGLISSLAIGMAHQREMLERMNNYINMIRAQL